MHTTPTVTATEATCPVCGWTALKRHSLHIISAAACHARDEHPDLYQQHFYFVGDAWPHIVAAWNPTPVQAVVIPDPGQIALFPTT